MLAPAHFPFDESFVDAAGQPRHFRIDGDRGPLGWVVTATEVDCTDEGYVFEASSETNWGLALGTLRAKIRRELATRYLDPTSPTPDLLHDTARGRITSGATGACLVIDGRPVSMDELSEILLIHEGFTFQLTITDPSE